MKTAFKFKSGSGAIFAFLILAVVFASVAGVVFILLNQDSSKKLEASVNTTNANSFAPVYNTCDFNRNFMVDQKDVEIVAAHFDPYPKLGVRNQYDVNFDWAVNSLDLQIIASKNQTYCYRADIINSKTFYFSPCDVNNDYVINKGDLDLIGNNFQPDRSKVTDDQRRYDVNRDGAINSIDLQIVASKNFRYCSIAVVTQPVVATAYNTCDLNQDGNIDKKDVDVAGAHFDPYWKQGVKNPYDVNWDGAVNSLDLQIIASNNQNFCVGGVGPISDPVSGSDPKKTYNKCDFNLDGVVNSGDQAIQSAHLGKITDNSKLYDVNGDGTVNAGDQAIVANYIATGNAKYCY